MHIAIEIAKNLVCALPPVRAAVQRHKVRVGLVPETVTPEYARRIFERHASAIENVRPLTGDVLEIGPGGTVAVAALFLHHGARSATCIDVIRWAEESDVCAKLGIESEARRVDYRSPVAVERMPFPSQSFDIVYSQACFQYFADPEAAVCEISRVLRPGGVTTHEIGLRDRSGTHPLAFLRYGEGTWRLATSNRPGVVPNRWRASDFLEAFSRYELETVSFDRRATIQVSEAERARMAARFRRKSLDDLSILDLFVTARKQHTGNWR